MGSLDENVVTRYFIDLAKTAIGSQLSKLPGNSTAPAVIKTRVGKQAPDYPYLVIKLEDTINTTLLGLGGIVVNDNAISYDRIDAFMYTFRVYGKDSINILRNLHQYFDLPNTLSDVVAKTAGGIRSIGQPQIDPRMKNGSYEESSYFTLVWAGHNAIEDNSSSSIDTADVTINLTLLP